MHAHICESINITLTRSLFDDTSESAWHFLNSGWHCKAAGEASASLGLEGERGTPGMRTGGPTHTRPGGRGPSSPGGLAHLLLEERGPAGGLLFKVCVVVSPTPPRHCPQPCLPLGCSCHKGL